MRHHSHYDVCPFCNNVVEADLAGTKDCPLCLNKTKTCTECGETKELREFQYNMSKDTLDYDDPMNNICIECQKKKAAAGRAKHPPKPRKPKKKGPKGYNVKTTELSPNEKRVLRLVQKGWKTSEICHEINMPLNSVSAYKSRGLAKLRKAGKELKFFNFD